MGRGRAAGPRQTASPTQGPTLLPASLSPATAGVHEERVQEGTAEGVPAGEQSVCACEPCMPLTTHKGAHAHTWTREHTHTYLHNQSSLLQPLDPLRTAGAEGRLVPFLA